jgi:hypothetical protein
MSLSPVAVLNNQTTNATSSTFPVYAAPQVLSIFGTLGGGRVIVETSPEGANRWTPIAVVSTADDGCQQFILRQRDRGSWSLRARLTGATGASVSVWLDPH